MGHPCLGLRNPAPALGWAGQGAPGLEPPQMLPEKLPGVLPTSGRTEQRPAGDSEQGPHVQVVGGIDRTAERQGRGQSHSSLPPWGSVGLGQGLRTAGSFPKPEERGPDPERGP